MKIFSLAIVALSAVSLAALPGCSFKNKNEPANTVHLYTVAKIKGLDPAHADDLYAGDMVGHVYEGLLEYEYLKRPFTLKPALAEAMPTVSADGKTYTFKIKKGVLFQDDPCFKDSAGKGRELVADDIIYTLKRVADPKTNSPGWWVYDGKIAGLNEWKDEAAKSGVSDYSKPVEGLKAVDRYTLAIKLNARSAQFLYGLAMTFAYVVPKEAVEYYGKEFLNHPVGTGPFRLEEFNPASRVVWVKNPTFRKELYPSTEGEPGDKAAGLLEDAGQPLPRSEKISYQIIVEDQPRWLNFMQGNLDVLAVPKDNNAQAMSGKDLNPELKAKGIRLEITPQLDITHDSFNMMDPVLGKNKLLRQAMSLAMDPGPAIELFYLGRALPAQGPIPPGIAGYDPNFKNPYRQFNVEKAKELLAKAGFPGGKGLAPIEFATVSSSTNRQINEYFAKGMSAIGIEVKFNNYSWPEFQQAVKTRKGQMWGFAWGADYPDAENFLQLFYSKNMSPGPNDSNYSNPEFDKLYEKSLTMQDTPERTALYQQMAKMVVEDAPWIFGVHRVVLTLVHPWVKNYKPHELEHSKAKYYRVDPSLKK